MIPSETWRKVRDSYIRGEGRLRTVADQHGLRAGTVERRAAIEDWSRLRREFETGELSKLLPSPPAMPPLPPPIPDGAVSEEFLRNRMQAYYRDNSRQLDVVRAHLAKALVGSNPEPEKLRSLTVTLNLLIEAEARLLGLRNRGRTPKKDPDHRRLGFAEPLWNPILRGNSTVVLHG